jgi:hypothetical protein
VGMHMRQRLLLVTCIAALAVVPHGARAQTDEELGIWAGLFVTGQVHASTKIESGGGRPSTTGTFRAEAGYQSS